MRRKLRGRRARALRARTPSVASGLAALALLMLVMPGTARADMGESDEAAVLVEQAIALIANEAGEAHVAERIEDALQAPHKEGVDLALVRRALEVVERTGEDEAAARETRRLLLESVGGKLASAPQGGRFATGTETGTSVVLDEFRPERGITDGGDAALVALACAAVVGGAWLSVRLRPRHSIHELERRSAEEEGRGR
ncbi:hypothetical protein [Streptomyces sp. NPDC018833]|uniref:hypothetical protein n=1 Tax=Streptomyces sp. NPDC018833 TaxID=3365053 RepID=UPI0037B2A54E